MCLIPIIWGAIELGLSAYDAYDAGKTLLDPKATRTEKWAAGGGFVLGLFAPGGGYGTGAKQGAKYLDNVVRESAEIFIVVGGKKVDNIDDFYKAAAKLDVGERVSTYKKVGAHLADKNNWTKNANLSKKNKRDIYTDADGNNYSLDTQHGRFEVFNKKGKHQGEIDFGGKLKKEADKSGKHDIQL
jgi:hypothetical protein